MLDRPRPIGPGAGGYIASEEQRRVDALQAAVRADARAPSYQPAPPPLQPLAPSCDIVERRLAEELDYARRLLEMLGEQLAGDPIILHRHAQTMQGFDRIGQIIGHVATVVQSQDKLSAIERIGMQEMRSRLTRRAL